MTTFAYTSGDPSHLLAGANASMADMQGPLVDLRTFLNGNISDINLSSSAAINENKFATGSSGMAKGAFGAYRAASVNLATGAVIVFDTEEFDVSGWFDTATGKFTPQVAGYYSLSWAASSRDIQNADVAWQATLRKNGTQFKAGMIGYQRGGTFTVNSTGHVNAVQANGTTDNFDVIISHTNAGGSTFVLGAATTTFFQGHLVGRA